MDNLLVLSGLIVGGAFVLFVSIDLLTRYEWDAVHLSRKQQVCKIILHLPFAAFLTWIAYSGITLMVGIFLSAMLTKEALSVFDQFFFQILHLAILLYALMLGASSSVNIARGIRASRHGDR